MLGKRKRDTAVARRQVASRRNENLPPETPSTDDIDVFRKHFEAMFEPLPESHNATPALDGDDEVTEASDQESEWEGLSAQGSEPELEDENLAIQIVEHTAEVDTSEEGGIQRQQYKKFMSSKPPKEIAHAATKKPTQQGDGEDPSEAMNLKHDLDLQRLLKESHLLEQARASSTVGNHRHKAIDMRMQSLGSKGSLFHQENMPLAHRRGILAKATAREKSRRKEAQENGIILEKAVTKSRTKDSRRDRGVDVPAVGKFRHGTLRLSKKDVLDIQGPPRSGRGGKGRRR